MAKKDIEFYARMQGMLYAQNIAKEKGIEALEHEIKKRGITRLPLTISEKDMDYIYKELSRNLYTNMITTVFVTLHEEYGFGKKRVMDFKQKFDAKVQSTFDLDYMGEHYVSLEDYAADMNEKFDAGIDIARVAACQDSFDERENKNFRKVDSKRIVEVLKEAGFTEASEYIERKIG